MTKLLKITVITFVITNNCFGQSVKYGSINLYLFCNTLDKKIGISCVKDRANVVNFFKKVSFGGGLNLNLFDYSDSSNWQQKLIKFSQNPRCLNGNINVFYFSSHGFNGRKDSSIFPTVILTNGKGLDLELFHNSIANYFEKVCFPSSNCIIVTIADVCNNFRNTYNGDVINLTKDENINEISCIKDIPISIDAENIEMTQKQADAFFLSFRKSYGNVIIASSSPGQHSLPDDNNGSLFTTNFLNSFENITSQKGFADWSEIIAMTKSKIDKFQLPIIWTKTAFYYLPYAITERDILRLTVDTTNKKKNVYFLSRIMPGGKILPLTDPDYPREIFSTLSVDYILTLPNGETKIVTKRNIREYFKIILKKNGYLNVSMKLHSKDQQFDEKKLSIVNYSKFPGNLNYHCWCNAIKPALDCHEKR